MFAGLLARFVGWKIYLGIALAVMGLLGVVTLKAYNAGQASTQAKWDKDKLIQATAALKASEEARAKEQVLITKTQKVSNDYQTEKKRRAADAVVSAGRLSDLTAALAAGATSADTPTPSGIDEPYRAIASECAAAIFALDEYAQGLASKARALQEFAKLCVSK